MNAHLTHICNYAQLWVLYVHRLPRTAKKFDSWYVAHQLLFNVDICCMFQIVNSKLQAKKVKGHLHIFIYNLTP